MFKFIGDHIGTIVQFLLTAWLAKVARDFQVTFSIYGTRLDTTREAVRRARVLWWLDRKKPESTDVINEMQDWIAVNEVYLTPAAYSAFMAIHLWKIMEGTTPPGPGMSLRNEFRDADAGWKALRAELLKFRKRPFPELLRDWAAGIFGKKQAAPKAGPMPQT